MQLKLERLHLNRKKIIISVVTVIVLVIGIMIIRHAYSVGTEETIFNQTVNELTFSEGKIEVENGISTLNLKVKNESKEEYNLKTITIEVTTNEGTTNLVGYVGESIEVGETKIIKASIDKEINSPTAVKYTINK